MDREELQSPPGNNPFAGLPGLAQLRLIPEDLQELASQGFVAPERRGERNYFKLRFRRGGHQVVRYVGGARAAAVVTEELAALQAGRRVRRELRVLNRAAREMLRESKSQLEPLLARRGFKIHGRAVRRCRPSPP
jgi:hypothetical protein